MCKNQQHIDQWIISNVNTAPIDAMLHCALFFAFHTPSNKTVLRLPRVKGKTKAVFNISDI